MLDLIINSIIFETIIVKYTANKLKLPLEPHPKPYKIEWIKSVEEINVTQYCIIPFYFFYLLSIRMRCIMIW
jgi:hypothetical protein